MRQTAVITLISVAVLAAVSLAAPVDEIRYQINEEEFAELIQEKLETDIPDDKVLQSIEISIKLVPKDSSEDLETFQGSDDQVPSAPVTGGRAPGRAPTWNVCQDIKCDDVDDRCGLGSNKSLCNKPKHKEWMDINCQKTCGICDPDRPSKVCRGPFSSRYGLYTTRVYN